MEGAVMAVDIEDREMQWLWKGYMPLGELVILDGDPSMGKSNVSIDLIARVTTNGIMPDGSKGVRGNAVILSPENGQERIKARLITAGANLNKVRVLPGGWTVPNHTEDIVAYMKQDKAKLLVLDPYAHILSAGYKMNNDQQVREAFRQLLVASHKYGFTIILVRHLKKGADCPILHRGEGTIGLIAMARAGYIVGQDPDNLDRRLMAMLKLNDGAEPETLAFFNKAKFESGSKDTAPYVEWDGVSPCTKDQLILSAKGDKNINRGNRVIRFLLEALADGERNSKDVLAEAAERGISPTLLSKGRTELGVERRKVGSNWLMSLPDTRSKDDNAEDEPVSGLGSGRGLSKGRAGSQQNSGDVDVRTSDTTPRRVRRTDSAGDAGSAPTRRKSGGLRKGPRRITTTEATTSEAVESTKVTPLSYAEMDKLSRDEVRGLMPAADYKVYAAGRNERRRAAGLVTKKPGVKKVAPRKRVASAAKSKRDIEIERCEEAGIRIIESQKGDWAMGIDKFSMDNMQGRDIWAMKRNGVFTPDDYRAIEEYRENERQERVAARTNVSPIRAPKKRVAREHDDQEGHASAGLKKTKTLRRRGN